MAANSVAKHNLTEQVSCRQAGEAVRRLADAINRNRDYLSQIDGATGDGDHGVNMSTGFTNFAKSIEGEEPTLKDALDKLGTTLLEVTGGSLGPLYGSMFLEMAEVVADQETVSAAQFSAMLQAALRGIQSVSEAKQGDKTLLDTLIPATESFDRARSSGKSFAESLDALREAAEQGKDSTQDMVARIGRASRLGERSRGSLDAGATSCCILLQSFAASFQEFLNAPAPL
jgi:phosphoenolpyruvate---glycerone phosphotransferase subunit DhaL